MAKKQKLTGRPPLLHGKRNRLINVRLTDDELKSLQNMENALQIKRADLIRSRVLENAPQTVLNTKELIRKLDAIGAESGRAGNNINQLARYANILNKRGIVSPALIERFNHLFESYLKNQAELQIALRKILKMMSGK